MRNEIKTHINLDVIPFAFRSLLFFVYHLSANFQSIWQYSHRNQLEPVSQNRLTDALCQSSLEFQLYTADAHSMIAKYTLFLSSAGNYQKTVTNLSGKVYSPHSSLLFFLSKYCWRFDWTQKSYRFFSFNTHSIISRQEKCRFFFLLNSFIDKVKDFSFLLQIHCENRRQFSQMEICHIIMEMSDFHPGHIDKKPWFLPRGWNFTNFPKKSCTPW